MPIKGHDKSKLFLTSALTAILTLAMLMLSAPNVKAADVDTYAFINVTPNPVGQGQSAFVIAWLDWYPPTAAGAQGDRWRNITITVWKPDGSSETMGPFTSDPVGIVYFEYTPTQVGTYQFQMHFPGQVLQLLNGSSMGLPYVGSYFKPSTSSKATLTVQAEPLQPWPAAELPTGYWERPIYGENREWGVLGGAWLFANSNNEGGAGRVNLYAKAPATAHIVWTKEVGFGGIAGGELGDVGYYTGETYEQRFLPPVIMQGRIYYNTPDPPRYGFYCVDLRTGETIWWRNSTGYNLTAARAGYGNIVPAPYTPFYIQIAAGQLYDYESPNQHGVIPYLWGWGTTGWRGEGIYYTQAYELFDAVTGNWILRFVNALTGTTVFGPKGELLVYMLGPSWVAMWNSSKAIPPGEPVGSGAWQWRPPLGATLDWRNGIQWNVTVPALPGQTLVKIHRTDFRIDKDGVIIAYAVPANATFPVPFTEVGYNALTGERIWVKTRERNIAAANYPILWYGPAGEGVYTFYARETLRWYAYDVFTGDQLWVSEPQDDSAWNMYTYGGMASITNGKLVVATFGGYVYAYDIKTGHRLWKYYVGPSGLETTSGSWPFYQPPTIADGKVYVASGEHSPNNPMWRGGKLVCLNLADGKLLWNISFFGVGSTRGGTAVAEGYLVALNEYDSRIYCFGKGPTSTTISASPKVAATGSTILIEGRVADESPGAKGAPVVADEDMTSWMEFLYMQKPCPSTIRGVAVTLKALGSNGKTIEIGAVTTDMNGVFKKLWTPPAEGEYTIVATFEGSESYWSSYTETAVGVVSAAAAGAGVSSTDVYIVAAAIIIAAVIIAIAILKRKQK